MAQQCASAIAVAEMLSKRENVIAVHYPGLKSFPQHELARKQMRAFGSVLAFEIRGGKDAARKFIGGVRLARPAVSLGGPETLVCHPASSTHVGMPPEVQSESGITDGLIRISIGLEATCDIVADLEQALT